MRISKMWQREQSLAELHEMLKNIHKKFTWQKFESMI